MHRPRPLCDHARHFLRCGTAAMASPSCLLQNCALALQSSRESQLHFKQGGNIMAASKKPSQTLRNGGIKATIWLNDGAKGRSFPRRFPGYSRLVRCLAQRLFLRTQRPGRVESACPRCQGLDRPARWHAAIATRTRRAFGVSRRLSFFSASLG